MGPHRFRNNQRMVPASEAAWQLAADNGMLDIRVDATNGQNRLRDVRTGHEFLNLSSCSYLGLNSHPTVVEAGIAALRDEQITGLAMAEFRIRLDAAHRLEDELSALFGTRVIPSISCGVISAAVLPLLASGHLTDSGPLVVVFDKLAHFSMNFVKPVVADEAMVLTSPHNDMRFLEEVCRTYPRVAYVCEGLYSTGGLADLEGIKALQEKYGMYVYLDDSHALSTQGPNGEGYARSVFRELDDRTMIVASTAKAFGSTGGIAMIGDSGAFDFLYRSGPMGWSQGLRTAAIGTTLGSIAVHRSLELTERQSQLAENVAIFDRRMKGYDVRGSGSHIKFVTVGDNERAVQLSNALYRRGYYCSAMFFPIVPRGRSGVRLMLRGDMTASMTENFVSVLEEVLDEQA
ncbi:2-amino-3-ketobutyrate CoA ligase [Streptomyces agglomeratus]|uniref:8-amino-7-oxononanoate synthase n=2 Tax=Streptomyces agglomeratus TaxID=285458 RepID=A0A1E5PI92_9ACTN|nr:2-amino-3-ketobutyrate CoA ligase [Streptomyces agglomeratus]OEJ42712.1 2-amino-3-ketobutyrate CoA ligase [Streptomyces agglomeratus]OEJ48775.1 2-amino-3-ketobutyrate CoA ligase [Streptomyces agglomeratus]OEJ56024.1 2-amino-3-ketobutyrate CoA ligase [Streptomyces agglomeratus]OEJ63414.1 2-amino-3-ketobutyrate CoA ligase [Streptomyces agglomeratus]